MPVVTKRQLPGDALDRQSRYIEAAVEGVLIGCLYAPNGNPQPGPKFDFKLAWLERLATYSATLIEAGIPAVLAGDFNVVPTASDMAPSRSMADNALVQPQSRAAFQRLLDLGWTDAIPTVHPGERMFTFWGYLRDRWGRDAGLRIDHLLLSPAVRPRLRGAGVDRAVRGEPDASDHAPAWITLAGERPPARSGARRVRPIVAPRAAGR